MLRTCPCVIFCTQWSFFYSVVIAFYFSNMGTQTRSNLLSKESLSSAPINTIQYNYMHKFTEFLTEKGCFPPPCSLEGSSETSLL